MLWAEDSPPRHCPRRSHKVVDYDAYPHYLGNVFKSGYRAQSIHAAIAAATEASSTSGGKISLDDMKAIQMDVTSLAARDFAQCVCRADVQKAGLSDADAALASAALESLRGWDGSQAADSIVASTYQASHDEIGRGPTR